MKQLRQLVIPVLFIWTGCQTNHNNAIQPPSFKVQPSVFQPEQFDAPHPDQHPKDLLSANGDKRTDPYYWLNERENPAVTAYLKAENQYADSVLAPVAGLREKLFTEMKARIQEDDNSVPYFKRGYWYYTRFEKGKEYPIYCRKKETQEAPESILLDVNELAKGHEFCEVDGLTVSPDNHLLAYAVDYSGRYLYKAFIKDLNTNELLPESFEVAGSLEWANDNQTLFYDTKDEVTLRVDKIWRHHIHNSPKSDVLMYEEKDETTYAYLGKSKSEQYIFVFSGYTQIVETHFLDANQPESSFQLFRAREQDFFYNVEHRGDKFLIRTNWNAPNFRLMETPVNALARENWKDVLPHREAVLLDDFTVFNDYLVTAEHKGGLEQIQVIRWSDKSAHYIDGGESTYSMTLDANPEFNTNILRYAFTSMKTPMSTIDYDMDSRQKNVRKVAPVLGGFDPNNYETEFIWVTARDGAKVPVSLMYRKGLKKDGSAPCHLTAYGSYGSSYPPYFNREKLSLVDRGFVIGIAHIRGGMEMGYKWYEDGKMMHKMNTFNDFIDCSQALCDQKYTSSDRLFAEGRSAGGLLMGAVVNMRPDLYKGIISGVPFVDVVTTMSDPSIPLTTGEYAEWGNPGIAEQYNYMLSYSPYDQVKAQAYPNMLVLTSFSDSQVQYFEPAKYVAKLRDLKTDKNVLLFRTNMSGSHGGSSGRFERLKERALEYSWMLGLLGSETEIAR